MSVYCKYCDTELDSDEQYLFNGMCASCNRAFNDGFGVGQKNRNALVKKQLKLLQSEFDMFLDSKQICLTIPQAARLKKWQEW
jgi:hypothetical protein